MIYVAIIGHGPEWISGRSVFEQDRAVVQAHLESMRHRFQDGNLLLGGPFDRAGGIAVWRADDLDHARRMMDADPGVATGLMDYDLYELTAYFDATTDHATRSDVGDLARTAAHRDPADPAVPTAEG